MLREIKTQNLTWIDILDPHEDDVKYLAENFDFHPLVLGEIIPPGWRPKVEPYDTYLFMILYASRFDEQTGDTIPQEVDIIFTKDTVITTHYFSISYIDDIFDKCKTDEKAKDLYCPNAMTLVYFILKSNGKTKSKNYKSWKTSLTKSRAGFLREKRGIWFH